MDRNTEKGEYYKKYTLQGKRKREFEKKELSELDKKIKKQHLEVFFSTDNHSEEEYV